MGQADSSLKVKSTSKETDSSKARRRSLNPSNGHFAPRISLNKIPSSKQPSLKGNQFFQQTFERTGFSSRLNEFTEASEFCSEILQHFMHVEGSYQLPQVSNFYY